MAGRRECPACGVSVKLENLERHVEEKHPRARVDLSKVITEEERRHARPRSAAPRPAMTKKGKAVVAVIAVILAAILLLIVINPFRLSGPQLGDPAPVFTAGACPSGVVTLSSYRQSVTVLELMDVNCTGCKSEAPVLASVYREYSTLGVRFLSVSLIDWVPDSDTCAWVAQFQLDHGTPWTYGMDYDHSVRNAYFPGSAGFVTPTTYILDSGGAIRAIFRGHPLGGAADYARAIGALLPP